MMNNKYNNFFLLVLFYALMYNKVVTANSCVDKTVIEITSDRWTLAGTSLFISNDASSVAIFGMGDRSSTCFFFMYNNNGNIEIRCGENVVLKHGSKYYSWSTGWQEIIDECNTGQLTPYRQIPDHTRANQVDSWSCPEPTTVNEGINRDAVCDCVSDTFGAQCQPCTCIDLQECNDGVEGDGTCTCPTGYDFFSSSNTCEKNHVSFEPLTFPMSGSHPRPSNRYRVEIQGKRLPSNHISVNAYMKHMHGTQGHTTLLPVLKDDMILESSQGTELSEDTRWALKFTLPASVQLLDGYINGWKIPKAQNYYAMPDVFELVIMDQCFRHIYKIEEGLDYRIHVCCDSSYCEGKEDDMCHSETLGNNRSKFYDMNQGVLVKHNNAIYVCDFVANKWIEIEDNELSSSLTSTSSFSTHCSAFDENDENNNNCCTDDYIWNYFGENFGICTLPPDGVEDHKFDFMITYPTTHFYAYVDVIGVVQKENSLSSWVVSSIDCSSQGANCPHPKTCNQETSLFPQARPMYASWPVHWTNNSLSVQDGNVNIVLYNPIIGGGGLDLRTTEIHMGECVCSYNTLDTTTGCSWTLEENPIVHNHLCSQVITINAPFSELRERCGYIWEEGDAKYTLRYPSSDELIVKVTDDVGSGVPVNQHIPIPFSITAPKFITLTSSDVTVFMEHSIAMDYQLIELYSVPYSETQRQLTIVFNFTTYHPYYLTDDVTVNRKNTPGTNLAPMLERSPCVSDLDEYSEGSCSMLVKVTLVQENLCSNNEELQYTFLFGIAGSTQTTNGNVQVVIRYNEQNQCDIITVPTGFSGTMTLSQNEVFSIDTIDGLISIDNPYELELLPFDSETYIHVDDFKLYKNSAEPSNQISSEFIGWVGNEYELEFTVSNLQQVFDFQHFVNGDLIAEIRLRYIFSNDNQRKRESFVMRTYTVQLKTRLSVYPPPSVDSPTNPPPQETRPSLFMLVGMILLGIGLVVLVGFVVGIVVNHHKKKSISRAVAPIA